MNLSNVRIGTKLAVGFALVLFLTLSLGILSYTRLASLAGMTEQIATNNLPSVIAAAEIRDLLNEMRRGHARHLLTMNIDEKDRQKAIVEDVNARLLQVEEKAAPLFNSETETKAFASYRQHKSVWMEKSKAMLEASRSFQSAGAETLYQGEAGNAFLAALSDVNELNDYNSKEADANWVETRGMIATAKQMVIAAIVLAIALGAVLAGFLSRAITVPIRQAVGAAKEMAKGDMTVALNVSGSDETAELLHSLEDMRTSLANVVSRVRRGSESVATASAEIAQGNNDLSSRTEQQASSLEETAASMEELNSAVQHNADNARQANQLALNASIVAAKGGEVVSEVVQTMREINTSSKKISDIISVIDGISFQTNILALNAAVEAARAGEQGRGFAVVASEVRSLAGRSAEAAKEIKSLISASVERVEHGTAKVDEAGATMTELVASVKRVSDIMGEISAASNEQSAGVSQVGEAVSHMDHATQQNAALVEQMAAAASSLKGQALELVETVAVFKVDASTGNAGAPARLSNPPPARAQNATPRPLARKTPPKLSASPKPLASPAPKSIAVASKPAAVVPKAASSDDEWETF